MARLLPWLFLAGGCSLGKGTGEVRSDVACDRSGCQGGLFVHECWGTAVDDTHAQGAPYDLGGGLFFAATAYRKTLQIRVQRGTDLTQVSDGLNVLIDDVDQIRAAIQGVSVPGPDGGGSGGDDAGDGNGVIPRAPLVTPCNVGSSAPSVSYRVALPVGLHPPGSPTEPPAYALSSLVHVSLYLERTCHNQNAVLYGVDGQVTFRALFDGDPNESSAADKFIDADFDVQLGDLADAPPGAYAGDVPVGLQSRITGCFRFYYQRGQPAQPFP